MHAQRFREHIDEFNKKEVGTDATRHPATARHPQMERALAKIDRILDRDRRSPEQHEMDNREESVAATSIGSCYFCRHGIGYCRDVVIRSALSKHKPPSQPGDE
jgi:hypothetical protein